MLRAIIFDFDGVIADSEPLHLAGFQRVLAEEGLTLSEEDYYEIYLGMDDREAFTTFLKQSGRSATPEQIQELVQRKNRCLMEALEHQEVLFPGVDAWVREAAQRYTLAIASGALRSEIEGVLKHGNLLEYFPVIVSAEWVTESKPSPQGFLKALEGLRHRIGPELQARECLVIEDSLAGIEAARRAGMPCLAVATTYPPERLQGADRVVRRLEEIPVSRLSQWFG